MGVQASADVADDARLGEGTCIWHLAQVRQGAVLGQHCIVGCGAYVGIGVRIGDNCKVQNYALVYEPAALEDGVFVGPVVVFTNDRYPRSITPDVLALRLIDRRMKLGISDGKGSLPI